MRRFLKYTKGEVDKAGDALAGIPVKNMSKDDAISVLENFRSIHIHPLNVFRMSLGRKAKLVSKSALISQRLKRAPSIIRKLEIQKKMSLSQMQDIGGLRAVVGDLKEVYKLRDLVRSSESQPAFKSVMVKEYDYVKDPKKSGYRSIHLVYKYEKNVNKNNQCRIEVQLRTKIQHAWATAVEVMGTYLNQPLKQSFGNKDWLDLLKRIGELFRDLEEKKFDRILFEETLKKVDEMKLVDLLEGFSSATFFSEEEIKKKKGKYFLITLDFKGKKLDIDGFPESKLDKANAEYTRLEKLYLNNKSIEVVLVSVDDIKNLRKLYPNYFLDTQEFIKLLNLAKSKLSN